MYLQFLDGGDDGNNNRKYVEKFMFPVISSAADISSN